jgi:Ser/Thr protein kinase RdoA (MazF antagonist)
MSLLQAPRFDAAGAERLARDLYGLIVAAAPLPSERDQNFLVTTPAGERFVLKIANGLEDQAILEAQNTAMAHVAARVDFCPRVVPALSGGTIAVTPDGDHLVRLVSYLAGTPLAKIAAPDGALLEQLGRAIGRLDAALSDFNHAAIHRDFHWDLANAGRVIEQYLPLVDDSAQRRLIQHVSAPALAAVDEVRGKLRRSAVHHDANDWNVLVSTDSARRSVDISGIIDFGDMVYSWTVADPAVAAAYAMLGRPDPLEAVTALARGYQREYALREEELDALFPLATLRLCMSACIAASQQQQRPDDEYLAVSQGPIRRTLPTLARIDGRVAAQAVRGAVG